MLDMTTREQSIAYWSERKPLICFREFLLCYYRMVNEGDAIKIPPEIRKLLFSYLQKHVQFHLKKRSGSKSIEIVTPINLAIPMNTMKCVHLSAKRLGRESWHYRLCFEIQDTHVLQQLEEIETNIKQSLKFNRWKPMLKGSTLFYTAHTSCGPEEYFDESDPTRNPESFYNHVKVERFSRLDRASLFQIGSMVDFALKFSVKGVVGKSSWSVNFSLIPI